MTDPTTPTPPSASTRHRRTVLVAALAAGIAVLGATLGVLTANATRSEPANPDLDPVRAVYALLDAYNRADPTAIRQLTCGALAEDTLNRSDDQIRADAQQALDEFGISWITDKPTLTYNPAGDAVEIFAFVIHEKTETVVYHPGLPGMYGLFSLERNDGQWKVCGYELH
ncbi:Rv0361 family membrane protein [Nocardia puris]|uniref:Rv0361 family membrane protein n=1 Tax=Nocardia puris TaxID=208602 RepID=UPI002E208749